jgi:hypothetical protein
MSLASLERPMKVTATPEIAHAPPMKHPTDPAPRIATLGATDIV